MAQPRSCLPVLVLVVAILFDQTGSLRGQRSLHHWKGDLEHRIKIYEDHRNEINNVIASSISAPHMGLPSMVRIPANSEVRFSDLIIRTGALKLSPHQVAPTVQILVNKTRSYAAAKANQLADVQRQLGTIIRQLDDPARQFIYKGVQGVPQPYYNTTRTIKGTRVFKQAQYVRLIETNKASVPRVNKTLVTRVIDDTYFRNITLGVYDSQRRLFFEGRKTFWHTTFAKPLKSGCCDRLRPLHTSRMMLRSVDQEVLAPLMIYSRLRGPRALIHDLSTRQLYNRPIELTPLPPMRPGDTGLLPASMPPSNIIQLPNLISISHLSQPEVLKTLVFMSPVVIEEASLANSHLDGRLAIGVASVPGFAFDLRLDNYLLKFGNFSQPVQRVAGRLVLETEVSFMGNIQAPSVNGVNDFKGFVRESLVFTNQPATIKGQVQFNAMPSMFEAAGAPSAPRRPSVLIVHAERDLQVGLLNGMRIPQDLVLLPSSQLPLANMSIRPTDQLRVRGARHFESSLTCREALNVDGPVNGLEMPAGVVPLHLNDFMSSVGHSNLLFADGISLGQMTIQSGQFDEIDLKDVNGGAQSIILNSMSTDQPDGTTLIRAPLRVKNLHLIDNLRQLSGSKGPPTGLLNGFRPQEVLELNSRYPFEILYGRKKFLAPVEATECIFSDINQVANWTNHLIRIDRPNTAQAVHTKLLFTQPSPAQPSAADAGSQKRPQLQIGRLNVEFHHERNPAHYEQNWNFSPELYLLHQALMRTNTNYTGGRYRVLKGVSLIQPSGALVNGIPLADIVRLDQPFTFADTFTMVGKVELRGSLSADRIQSNYPIDALDLVQFDKYRIPILGKSLAPIQLNNLVLGEGNRASHVHCLLLNGTPLNEFIQSIMSLTRPQSVASSLVFQAPVSFEGMVRTRSALNGIKNFNEFAQSLKSAKYVFEEGLQCNSVIIRT